jgi:hypothetical protein
MCIERNEGGYFRQPLLSAILLADDAVRSIVLGLCGRKIARIAAMADLALLATGVLARRTLRYIGQR